MSDDPKRDLVEAAIDNITAELAALRTTLMRVDERLPIEKAGRPNMRIPDIWHVLDGSGTSFVADDAVTGTMKRVASIARGIQGSV